MIQKLRRKFILIAMGSLLAVMAVILGVVNGVNLYQIDRRADHLLEILAENDGKFPQPAKRKGGGDGPPPLQETPFFSRITEETPFETRYFWVRTSGEGNGIGQIDAGHIAAVSAAQARTYGEEVLESGKSSGYKGMYKYLVKKTESGKLVIFVDCSTQLATGVSFLLVSCGVALVSLLGMLLLVTLFSRRAVRPIAESLEKQKQFITDAGHEIKTPLSIIAANAEVLELENGSSEWLDSIQSQTRRLTELVNNLLALSRMEEDQVTMVFADFCVSDTVYEAAVEFETLAESQGKSFELNIQPGLALHGDQGAVRRLVSILVENAVKYADEKGEIRVELAGNGKAVRLDVSNTCSTMPEGDLDRLFDRFFRVDPSRDRRTGGFGIGLSAARAIVNAHKGEISARKAEEGTIHFIAQFG